MFCQKCGKEMPNDANMCPYCGNVLTASQPSSSPKEAKKNNSIKILIVCISCILVISLIGIMVARYINNRNDEPNNFVVAEDYNQETTTRKPAGKIDSTNGVTIGAFQLKYKKASTFTESDGTTLLIVTYSFTNSSSENACFAWSIRDEAYQNGIQLEPDVPIGIDNYDYDSSFKNIQPGTTIDVQQAYKLNDKSKIEIQFGLPFTSDIIDNLFITIK